MLLTVTGDAAVPSTSPPQRGMAGGWHPRAPGDKDVRSAALSVALAAFPAPALASAAAAAALLASAGQGAPLVVCSASSQVVAGTNFKVQVGLGGCGAGNDKATGVVFRSLPHMGGEFSVSGFELQPGARAARHGAEGQGRDAGHGAL